MSSDAKKTTEPFSKASIEEQAAIGAFLYFDGPWPEQVYDLEPEHFHDEDCAKAYVAIESMRGDRGPIDVVGLRNKLVELGYKYLDGQLLRLLDDCPAACNLDHWAGLITDAWRKREIARVTADAISRGETSDQMAEEIKSALSGTESKRTSGLTHIGKHLPAVIRELHSEYEDPDSGLIAKTNLADLDSRAKLLRGELTIIAARPSMGKSALAGNISSYCARDLTRGIVALFSLEMNATSLIRRMMANTAHVPLDQLAAKAERGELLETFDKLHRLNLYINDHAGLAVNAMRADLSRFSNVRMVIVDYLQLTKHDAKLERQDLRVGETVKLLKGVAKDFDCHVLALSQLNRKCEGRNPPIPVNADLRDSGQIEEHADNIWFLYRPSYYYDSQPEHEATIIVSKQRNGEVCRVNVWWDGKTQTFANLDRGHEE